MAPIRIARIITRLNVGGPAIQAIDLSARLEDRGYHSLLIHGRLGPGEGDMRYLFPAGPRFEVMQVPALRREPAPAADAAALVRIFRLLCRFRPALVHTHMAKAGTIGRTAALLYNAMMGRRAPARIVHTYHGHVLDGYFSATTTKLFSAAERMLGRRSDALVAVSPRVRADLLQHHAIGIAERFHLIALGFDLSALAAIGAPDRARARARLGLAADAHVVALVGRLTAIKQPGLFLDAAARLAAVDARAQFLIAGGGELEPGLRAQADALGIGGRVHFLGWRRDLPAIYAASDLVALTSRNEGTPVALIESMAAAVPTVAFAVGGVPDLITGPDLGALVGEGDVAGLTEAMRRLLDDSCARRIIGDRARAHVVERFHVDRLVCDIDALYRHLIS